jgi:hypothetical protein
MVPGKRLKPKSPFMDMMLVPVYGGGHRQQHHRQPRIQQNLGLRTAEVVQGFNGNRWQSPGNERDQSVVQRRAAGLPLSGCTCAPRLTRSGWLPL